MTAVPPWTFPGSRTLAGWWRQLAPLQPRQLWVGHLLFHRVEALVGLNQMRRPDRFTRLVLDAIASRPGQEIHAYEGAPLPGTPGVGAGLSPPTNRGTGTTWVGGDLGAD